MSDSLADFLPYRLSRLSEAVSAEIRPIYKAMHGLNRPEWRVLAALADLGSCTATEAAAHSAQHKTKVSRAVYALESRRWLKRETDPRDRRSEILTLTAAGRAAYDSLITPLRSRAMSLVSTLDPGDAEALVRGLAALEAALDLAAEAPAGVTDRATSR
ncbi:MarR family transcriptional regulator [Rhodobacterales bacterium HKCCE3408]|nr:MarR family transcriptional regulator [Rhodobacterales bacterium HKCCE3408]